MTITTHNHEETTQVFERGEFHVMSMAVAIPNEAWTFVVQSAQPVVQPELIPTENTRPSTKP